MRTKTLLLTAALSAAGIASSMAQVYSVNAVGYVNTDLVPGFNLISNPLIASDNTIAGLFGTSLPEGSIVYKYNGTGFTTAQFTFGTFVANGDVTVEPGEGMFVRVGSPVTITFVGEVPQGDLSVEVPAGFSIRSSIVPQAGTVEELGFPAAEGDTIYQYESEREVPGYYTSQYNFGTWNPALKPLEVGEAVFVRTGASKNWTRSFSVNDPVEE